MVEPIFNLRQFIQVLRSQGEVVDVYEPVDPNLEIAEIHRRVIAAGGPALLFHRVKGSDFPVVTNLFGTQKRVSIAFQNRPEEVIKDLLNFVTKEFPPTLPKLWNKRKLLGKLTKIGMRADAKGAVLEEEMNTPDLTKLPLLTSWPEDGGAFITLPLVYTQSVENGTPNLGMYRIHRYDKTTTGLHFQIAKGGGFHYHQAEQMNENLPVAIYVGGPPALILSAIAPLPENVPELLLASFLQGSKMSTGRVDDFSYPILNECEFAILGEARPKERRLEGPFGDHYGYYSWAHEFPVFNCKRLFHRKGAIYPATIVGKPRQEDFFIGDYLQELLSPLFPIVMPAVKSIWSYGETGFHSLSAAVVYERYYRESMASVFRILGEGQLALTKFLLITDQLVNVRDIKTVLKTVLERFKPQTDLFIFANLSLDTLDYTGPELNKGSRGVMLGVGEKIRDLLSEYTGELPRPLKKIRPFCPGCLVLEGPSYTEYREVESLLKQLDFAEWPLLVLVDDLEETLKSDAAFLWRTFTRFEPAADIHASHRQTFRHHLCYEGPILIDARMKPSYPPEVMCDLETSNLVTQKWGKYFPSGMMMGESESANV